MPYVNIIIKTSNITRKTVKKKANRPPPEPHVVGEAPDARLGDLQRRQPDQVPLVPLLVAVETGFIYFYVFIIISTLSPF